jgi:hypothetical protein
MEKVSVLTTGLLSKEKPIVIDDLKNGQGTFLYNHNIHEVLVIEDADGGITITEDKKKATGKMWQYDSLRVEYPKTRKNMYATLLEARYPQDVQQKLVNYYQAAEMGILEDEEADEAEAAYRAFLTDRKAIKAMVKEDCLENNIPEDL